MVALRRIFSMILLISILFSVALNVRADKVLVYDGANLFTEEERLTLEKEANNLSNEYNMDIVIVTTNDAEGKTSREYADDFFDYSGFGVGEDRDGILFLIDMDNREVYISTSGIAIRYLTDYRIEKILDKVFDEGLLDGDYFGATMAFINGARTYLEAGIPKGQYNEPESKPKEITAFDIVISIAGGLIASLIFYFTVKSRYKTPRTYGGFSFSNNSIVNFMPTEDRLISSFVTHRVIPRASKTSTAHKSSTVRSTTHRSSSGRTHGGGGRKF